jgi:hypothetical protein
MRRTVAMLVSFAMAVTQVFAQGSGYLGAADSPKQALSETRDRINDDKQLSPEQKALHLERVEIVEREMAVIEGATSRVVEIATRAEGPLTPARKAEIEAEVRELLAQVGSSQARLGALKKDLTSEFEASKDLTPQQKEEFRATLVKLKEKKISLQQAFAGLGTSGDRFELFVVLIILLVLVGAGFGNGVAGAGGSAPGK